MNPFDAAIYIRSYPGSPRGGDAGCIIPAKDGSLLVALIDASGHGLAAYHVAQKCRSTVVTNSHLEPDALLTVLDDICNNSIGAAASVVRIRNNLATFAGIGNVSVKINDKQLDPKLGILGKRMRTPELLTVAFTKGSRLVMHSDGISRLPTPLPNGGAQTVATMLVNKWGSPHDDAAALIVHWPDNP